MVRLPRIVVLNQPLHIMHRGNNRQDIFQSEEDMIRIKEDIAYALAASGDLIVPQTWRPESGG